MGSAATVGDGLIDAEGFRWITVRDCEEADALLASWGGAPAESPPLGLFKFPRTHHVLNTGGYAVTRDDLVMSEGDASPFFDGRSVVVAEEKIDGSNLGFSLTKDFQILAQNRSHFVNTQSHTQFRPLQAWLDEHGWALCQLLEPEVEVLYGEWMVAQHSVKYDRLPGYFVAFDLYNKRSRSFCSVAERNRRLEGLAIPIVRTIAKRAFTSKADLLTLLETRSAYTDGGFVEGAYLRIDEPDEGVARNARRGKIVRPDFIQGITEHWINAEVVKNVVRADLWEQD